MLFKKMQSSFTGGEISPRLLARSDLKVYEQALQEMVNGYPLTHGGATRRYGTTYLGAVRDSADPVRLIRYVNSRTASFLLVLNDGKMQFIKNKAWVVTGGTTRYELTIPYTNDELAELTYCQAGNVMIFCHPNHKPKVLQRSTDISWTLTDIDFVYNALSDFPYENHYIRFQIVTAGDGHFIGTTYTITVNGDGTYSYTGPAGGSPESIGSIAGIEVNQNAIVAQTWTIACVFDSSGREEWTVTGSVSGQVPAQWSANNYPKACSFYEQRLYFAGTSIWPQRIWGSVIADYFNLTPGANDGDALDFQIASNSYDQIVHLESTRSLQPLTYGSEFSMSGPSGATITPGAVSIRAHTFHGSADTKPIRIGQELLFVQRDKKKVRAISYDLALDSNVAPDLTILAEHISGNGITDMSYAQDPDAILWLVRSDGVMLSLTHMREQEVTAWARHTTDGSFRNVCVLPEAESDTVYLCVERNLNGSTVKCVEYIATDHYLDCASVQTAGSPTATWTGLTHLNGETVTVVADGRTHPPVTVSGGSITLTRSVSSVVVGFPFTTKFVTLHPEIPMSDGTSQGRQVRVVEMVLRLQDTVGVNVNGNTVPVIELPLDLDTAPVPFTGDKNIYNLGWGYPINITIEQSMPMPFTLLGIILKVEVND